MASVFRPSGRRIYRVKFTDQHGSPRVASSDMLDRRAAQGLAGLIERDVDRIKAGLQPERPDITGPFLGLSAIAPQHLPLDQVIDSFLADLDRQGMSAATLRTRRTQLSLMRTRGVWRTLRDITTHGVSSTLAAFAKEGKAVHTTNTYRASVSAFLNWCIEQGYSQSNPVAKVRRARSGGLAPRRRRPFTPDELRRLVETHPAHADLYLTAALTGLRKMELSLVQRRDFDLETATWQCRPEIDKMNKAHRLPIVPDLLPVLERVCAGKTPAMRLFPRKVNHETLAKQLRRAGVRKVSDDGRQIDFHSLRYTFCTLLAGKLPLKVVQRMMRHASLKQTADLYLQLDLDSMLDQVVALPPLLVP